MEKNFNAKEYLNWLIATGKIHRIKRGQDIEEYAENAQRIAEYGGLSHEQAAMVYGAACERFLADVKSVSKP